MTKAEFDSIKLGDTLWQVDMVDGFPEVVTVLVITLSGVVEESPILEIKHSDGRHERYTRDEALLDPMKCKEEHADPWMGTIHVTEDEAKMALRWSLFLLRGKGADIIVGVDVRLRRLIPGL